MYQALLFAMNLALLANNIGLLWVAIELATLITVLMVGLYRTPAALEAAWKYFILGSLGIALALFGTIPVSYTHLDVYKRQLLGLPLVLLACGVYAVVAAHRSESSRRIYGAALAVCLLLLALALGYLLARDPPLELALPLGLPWLGMHFRLDALSAFFLIVVDLGGAITSLFALGYGQHERAPERVLPFFPTFLAGMNWVVLADDAFSFLFAWEFMSVSYTHLDVYKRQLHAAGRHPILCRHRLFHRDRHLLSGQQLDVASDLLDRGDVDSDPLVDHGLAAHPTGSMDRYSTG